MMLYPALCRMFWVGYWRLGQLPRKLPFAHQRPKPSQTKGVIPMQRGVALQLLIVANDVVRKAINNVSVV